MVAYVINPSSVESPQYKLVVQDLSSGEVRELDSLVNFWGLEWSPDGKVLVYSNGPYESAQVYGYDLRRGEAVALAEGREPSVARP
jgi:Tol biopolymer transport system component